MSAGGVSSQIALADWKGYINRVSKGDKPAITTLEAFGGDPQLLLASLAYAQRQGVDVMVAAESDGSF